MLWLHIGLPKTGSSAIQAYLRQNRQALSDMGVFYAPAPKEGEDDWRISSGNGVRLARQLSGQPAPDLIREGDPVKGFARRFVSPDHPISLVSSEGLAGAEPGRLARFRDEAVGSAPVRVLALVRDVYGHAVSTWRQTIKRGGYDGSLVDFLHAHYHDAQGRLLATWAGAFGEDALHVVHYDSIADDLIAGVFQAIGMAAPPAAAAPLVNRSLTVNETAVLAECSHLHGGSVELARRLSDHLIYRHPERTASRVVDEEAAAIIAERFGAEVSDLNARYFGGREVLRVGPTEHDRQAGGREPELAEVWRDVAEAMLQAYGQETAEVRELEVLNLVRRVRKRLRQGEGEAAREMLQRALALDPENRQALALAGKIEAAAARKGERAREREEDEA